MENMRASNFQIGKLFAGILYCVTCLLPDSGAAQEQLPDHLKSLMDKQPRGAVTLSFGGQMPPPTSLQGLFMGQFLKPGPFERSMEEARLWFRSADLDMNGVIGPGDKEVSKDAWSEMVWLPVITNILRHDLNFDGIVTREEVFKAVDYRIRRGVYIRPNKDSDEALRQRIDQETLLIMQTDRNGDGRLDIQEIMAFVRQTLPLPSAYDYHLQVVLAMDENADGSVTLDEFNAHVERMLRAIDTDGDDSLSNDEIKAYRTKAVAAPLKSAR